MMLQSHDFLLFRVHRNGRLPPPLTPQHLLVEVRELRVAIGVLLALARLALPIELGELKDAGIDWSLLGFDQDELAKLLDPGVKQGLTDPDEIPEPPDEAITQPGGLWVLGEHRLLCGDSSSVVDVEVLLAVDPAKAIELPAGSDIKPKLLPIHLCNTDPPYNVRLEPRCNNAISKNAVHTKRHGPDE